MFDRQTTKKPTMSRRLVVGVQFNMTMAFETTEKPNLCEEARLCLWLVTRAVGKLRCVLSSRRTHVYYISTSVACQRLFCFCLFRLAETTETICCGSKGDKPTPTPTGEHPNDDERRQDEQPTRTTHDERQGERKQERNANRTATQQNGKRDKQNHNHEGTTTDEGNGRSEPTPTDDERESREPTTRRTPPKKIICLLALISIYQVFNYKVKGFTRLADVFFS